MKFNAPIPGESLTHPPKKFPWERPPELVDFEDIAEYYLERLTNKEVMESLMDLLELDNTVKELTEGLVRIGVSRGMHTLDAGLLVAPIIHEAIRSSAEFLGIDYEEGFEDKEAKKKAYEASRRIQARKLLKGVKPKPLDDDIEDAFDEGEVE